MSSVRHGVSERDECIVIHLRHGAEADGINDIAGRYRHTNHISCGEFGRIPCSGGRWRAANLCIQFDKIELCGREMGREFLDSMRLNAGNHQRRFHRRIGGMNPRRGGVIRLFQ